MISYLYTTFCTGASSEDEDFEPPAEDEIEKIEEHDDQLEGSDSVDSEDLQVVFTINPITLLLLCDTE